MVLAMNGKLGLVRSWRSLAVLGGIAGVLVLALLVLRPAIAPGRPVFLRTTDMPGYANREGCPASGTAGMLVINAAAGTAVRETEAANEYLEVAWPAGYTGRQSGAQVEVLDRHGNIVARTGSWVSLLGVFDPGGLLVCDPEPIPR
jgi:hypothetical protein